MLPHSSAFVAGRSKPRDSAVTYFFALLTLAHLALVAAIILALPSGLNGRFFLGAVSAGAEFGAFTLAHLAFAAALNFARCAAENRDFLDLATAAALFGVDTGTDFLAHLAF